MPRFTFDKIEYEMVPTSEWTFAEARIAKRVSGGMSVAEVEREAIDADPDALTALVAVSVLRVWKDATEKMIVDRIDAGEVPMIRLLEELAAEPDSEAGDETDGPPTVPGEAVPVTTGATP